MPAAIVPCPVSRVLALPRPAAASLPRGTVWPSGSATKVMI